MTYTDSRIPGIILADDGTPNPDDFVDVSQQVSNNFSLLAAVAGIAHYANAAALPATNNFTGRLAMTDNDGAIWQYIAGWQFLQDTQWQTTWKPTITAVVGPIIFGTGGGTYVRYYRIGQKIKVTGWLATGTSGSNWGNGSFFITIPYKSTSIGSALSWGVAQVNCRGEDHNCISRIDPNETRMKIYPLWYDTGSPNGAQRVRAIAMQNADSPGGAPGTGIPRFTGAFTFDASNAGYWNWDIEYFFDINQPVATSPGP